jgi:hypothetical protein
MSRDRLKIACTLNVSQVLKIFIIQQNSSEVSRLISVLGVNPVKYESEIFPLHNALAGPANSQSIKIVSLLLKSGCNPALKDLHGRLPIECLCLTSGSNHIKKTRRLLTAYSQHEIWSKQTVWVRRLRPSLKNFKFPE